MLRKDIIEMSVHELKRLKVIQEVIGRHITQKTAAEIMGLSERQIRRVIKAVREEGDRGVIHKGRGKQSNRKLSEKVRQKVIKL
ncbi:MAG: helix-turn-helix domain-containing protein, partial [Planctomycetota bacterium]